MNLRLFSVIVVSLFVVQVVSAGNVLWSEDFEDGSYTDSMYKHHRSNHTVDVRDGGVPSSGKYLYTNDFLNWGVHISSKVGFDYVGKHLEYSTHMAAGSASFSDQRFATFFIKSDVGANSNWLTLMRITGSNYSGTSYTKNRVYLIMRYLDDQGVQQTEHADDLILPGGNGNAFNHAKQVILPSGIMEFYVNDVLLYTSTNSIDPRYDGGAAIMVGNRKSNYDNVMVTEFDAASAVPAPLAVLAGPAVLFMLQNRKNR